MQDFITFLTHHPYLIASIICVALLLFILEGFRIRKNMSGVTPQMAVQLINHEHAMVIDIRNHELFKKGHIVHAHNMTADAVLSDKKIDKMKNKPLIIVCAAGISANRLTSSLQQKGFKAYNLQGGMKAWYDAKLPTVSEPHHA